MNYSKYITKQLKNSKFTEEQIQVVLDIVLELLPKEKDDALSLVKYANRKFEARYGNQDIFCIYPIPSQIMKYVSEFQANNKLSGDDYRKFIQWIVLEGESFLKRIPKVSDLYLSKLYSIFEHNKHSESTEKKKKALSKNLLLVE